MRRSSKLAQDLTAALAATGVAVSPRQLDSWSQAGLLPVTVGCDAPTVAHVAAVAAVYRPGPKAADRAALVIAARGFACPRLRDAIARYVFNAGDAVDFAARVRASRPAPVQATTPDGLALVEAVTVAPDPDSRSSEARLIRDAVGSMAANAILSAAARRPVAGPAITSREHILEAPESVLHSALVNMTAAAHADGVYDTAWAASLGLPEWLVEDVLGEGYLLGAISEAFLAASDAALVGAARRGRFFMAQVPGLTDEQREIAGTMAGCVLYGFMWRFVEVNADAFDMLPAQPHLPLVMPDRS